MRTSHGRGNGDTAGQPPTTREILTTMTISCRRRKPAQASRGGVALRTSSHSHARRRHTPRRPTLSCWVTTSTITLTATNYTWSWCWEPRRDHDRLGCPGKQEAHGPQHHPRLIRHYHFTSGGSCLMAHTPRRPRNHVDHHVERNSSTPFTGDTQPTASSPPRNNRQFRLSHLVSNTDTWGRKTRPLVTG